jgi:DNA-directed RNA polymerase specialized sigma24 family protein
MSLVKTWDNFNPERSSNPFAFFTQCIKNSFIQYLKLEKRQRVIRDELLVDSGLTPSYNYQMEYEAQRHVHDEEDHEQHVKDAKELDEQEQKDDILQY